MTQIKIDKLLKIIKKLKKEINSKLKTAKNKRAEVISKRRKLAEIEMNLRSMRATAVKIREKLPIANQVVEKILSLPFYGSLGLAKIKRYVKK